MEIAAIHPTEGWIILSEVGVRGRDCRVLVTSIRGLLRGAALVDE